MGIKDNNIIKIHNLNKEFVVDKNPIRVLNDINLDIREGEFITIVGHFIHYTIIIQKSRLQMML